MQLERNTTDLTQARGETEKLVEQLREIQEQFQLFQRAANIGIFDWNMLTGAITWTTEAEKLYGLQPGTFGGTFESWAQSVHPDDLPEACEQVFASIDRRTPLDVQFRVIWPENQSIHWIYAKARTFYDQQGKPLRMLGINMDITDRKQYEEELQIHEEKLRLFAESDIIGMVFSTIYGDILYANAAFSKITGYSQDEIQAEKVHWTDITPPEWLLVDQQQIAEIQRTGKPALYEKQYFHKDGHRVDVLLGYLLFGKLKDQAVAFVLDVSERKRLERQKDEFIGVVSHELRTPVTSLKVFAQLLQKRFLHSGDLQNAELLWKMSSQIDKLTRLIDDLIDVTKLEAGKLCLHKTDFDLLSLIDEVIEEMQRTTTRHTIVKEGTFKRTIRGDRSRIGQVLINLLSNAIKYSPQADTILVKVSSDEEHAVVSVQDFGLGISPEKQRQIFQRFYRVNEKEHETIPGMGLGLFISAEMIKRHGGDLRFESRPGHGSTFSFSIPLLQERAEASNENGKVYEQENSHRG